MLVSVNSCNLIKIRKQRNLSQHKLSLLAGLSNNAIFRMEKGDSKVSDLRAKAVANALECDMEEIFNTFQKDGD